MGEREPGPKQEEVGPQRQGEAQAHAPSVLPSTAEQSRGELPH